MQRRTSLRWIQRRAMIAFSFSIMLVVGCPLVRTGTDAGDSATDGADEPAGQPTPPEAVELTVFIEGRGSVEQDVAGMFLTLTAVPDTGWRFDAWFGTAESQSSQLTIKPSDSTSISVRFIEVETETDTDGDGVTDDVDLCADTPSGENANTDGCAASQLDGDGDGVSDGADRCLETPEGATVDADGCAASELDSDGDGVFDDLDECPDTPGAAAVDANGCSETQRDSDGDGVVDSVDQCPATPEGTAVNDVGCPPPTAECGNGIIEAGELCDPPDGVICASDCQLIVVSGPANDNCGQPIAVSDGDTAFSTNEATTDGPDEPDACDFGVYSQIGSDIWFCYEASCAGATIASLCDSDYDSKLAVYAGCDCPTADPVACDDDACGQGGGSQVTFAAETGQSYLIRVGGWSAHQGSGTLTINCNLCVNDPLGDGDGDGICGSVDNCPDDANPLQEDLDQDDVGDLCDSCPNDPSNDGDGDGVCGSIDNCPNTANVDQADADTDGVGDLCDNCSEGSNSSQEDSDGDGVGDVCDNCPADGNPPQNDADGDGVGNVCDNCPDTAPGTPVDEEGCPTTEPESTPTAVFEITPDPPVLGEEFTVDASLSFDRPEGDPIASYTWDWGDGTAQGTGVTATHTYNTPGTHTLSLTVADAEDPPNIDTTSRVFTFSPPASTWDSAQLLGQIFTEYRTPESYDLDGDGELTVAHLTLNEDSIVHEWNGPTTILSTDVPLGIPMQLYLVTNAHDTPGVTVTVSLGIYVFELDIDGSTGTWAFDYIVTVETEGGDGDMNATYRHVGQQTGIVSPDGSTITWTNVSGTYTGCDSQSGCRPAIILSESPGWSLGVWTKQ